MRTINGGQKISEVKNNSLKLVLIFLKNYFVHLKDSRKFLLNFADFKDTRKVLRIKGLKPRTNTILISKDIILFACFE